MATDLRDAPTIWYMNSGKFTDMELGTPGAQNVPRPQYVPASATAIRPPMPVDTMRAKTAGLKIILLRT
jgi:hypothetical protein